MELRRRTSDADGAADAEAWGSKARAGESEGAADGEAQEFKAHVGELPFSANETSIQEFFEGCGDIFQCDLLYTHDGKSRGIAFVNFATRAGLEAALKLNGQTFRGRAIKVSEAVGHGKRERSGKGKGKGKDKGKDIELGNLAGAEEARIELGERFKRKS